MARGTGRGEQKAQQLQDVQQFARRRRRPGAAHQGRNVSPRPGSVDSRGQDILRATADVRSASPNDATAGDRFVYALGQVRSRGALSADELRQLTRSAA